MKPFAIRHGKYNGEHGGKPTPRRVVSGTRFKNTGPFFYRVKLSPFILDKQHSRAATRIRKVDEK